MDIFKSMNSTDRLPWKVQEYVEKFKYNQHLCTNTIELDCVDFTYEVEDLTKYISEDLIVDYEAVEVIEKTKEIINLLTQQIISTNIGCEVEIDELILEENINMLYDIKSEITLTNICDAYNSSEDIAVLNQNITDDDELYIVLNDKILKIENKIIMNTNFIDYKVPIMTSNTSPSGEASSYNAAGSNHNTAYLAFDRTYSHVELHRYTIINTYILAYEFDYPEIINNVHICFTLNSCYLYNYKIQASNNFNDWITLFDSPDHNSTLSLNTNVDFYNITPYKYYRFLPNATVATYDRVDCRNFDLKFKKISLDVSEITNGCIPSNIYKISNDDLYINEIKLIKNNSEFEYNGDNLIESIAYNDIEINSDIINTKIIFNSKNILNSLEAYN